MRAIWKGAVSFGLVSISVKLYSATEEKNIRFHQVHRTDGGRIRYQRVCSVCGEQVSYDDIAKGYDIGGGEIVVLTDEDFADLPLASSRAIDVLEFVPAEQIDPIMFNKAYYLEPEGNAAKPYLLLRDALVDSERVAVVKVALRQREQLATLRVRDGVLVLNTMLWPDEVRAPEFGFLDESMEVRAPELAMAASLIDSMTGEFDADAYSDDYREALQEVIDAKVGGREVVAPTAPEEEPAAAVDLMAALRASVDRARASRGEEGEGEAVEPTPITSARSRRDLQPEDEQAQAPTGEAAPAKKATEKATRKSASKQSASKKATPAKRGTKKATPAKKSETKASTGKAGAKASTGKAGAKASTAKKAAKDRRSA